MQTHITFIQRVAWYYENEIAHHSLANKAISNDNKYNNNIYMDVSGSLSPSSPHLCCRYYLISAIASFKWKIFTETKNTMIINDNEEK